MPQDLNHVLAELGVDLEAADDKEVTPLSTAAFRGHASTVRLLVSLGANVAQCRPSSGWTALHSAADGGHGEVIRILISEYGLAVNIRMTNDGRTPLCVAATSGRDAAVRVLVAIARGPQRTSAARVAKPNARSATSMPDDFLERSERDATSLETDTARDAQLQES